MKKHESTKGSRKWVIKAMIGFIAVLAVLTFFSNTIMNATIPLVVTSNAMRGNLSYTNNATGQLVSDNQIEVKGLEGRVVDQVMCSNYDQVSEGDVILTLQPVEDMSELTQLEQQLVSLQHQQETAQMTPNHSADLTAQNLAIRTAERALAEAQANLNSATTRDETIAAAQQVLLANQAAVNALQAQVASASASVEYINTQLAGLYARLAVIDGTANVVIPTTVPSVNAHPGMVTIGKNDPSDPADPDTPADPNAAGSAADASTGTSESSETSATTTAPSETSATSATAAPTPIPASIADTSTDRATIVNQIAQLQGQLADAQNRLTGYSSQLAAAQAAVTAAQTAITQAEALPSTYAAQDTVADAQAALNSAQIALSDAQANANVAALTAQFAIEEREAQIADLESKIEKTRQRLEQTTIVAPADGYVYNMVAVAGDKLTEQAVIFTIVPENSTFSVSFTFPTNVAQSMAVGQQFTSNYYYISSIVITNIKPDANNPRGNRIVKCAVTSSSQLWPGESITVTADRGNSTYDHVVASSAVSEDNAGQFVFVVDKSSGPLGDRYVVRRVSVTVEARSGAFAAITGEGLDGAMVVTRSDVPLHNGDRVRLEDFSSNQT